MIAIDEPVPQGSQSTGLPHHLGHGVIESRGHGHDAGHVDRAGTQVALLPAAESDGPTLRAAVQQERTHPRRSTEFVRGQAQQIAENAMLYLCDHATQAGDNFPAANRVEVSDSVSIHSEGYSAAEHPSGFATDDVCQG